MSANADIAMPSQYSQPLVYMCCWVLYLRVEIYLFIFKSVKSVTKLVQEVVAVTNQIIARKSKTKTVLVHVQTSLLIRKNFVQQI